MLKKNKKKHRKLNWRATRTPPKRAGYEPLHWSSVSSYIRNMCHKTGVIVQTISAEQYNEEQLTLEDDINIWCREHVCWDKSCKLLFIDDHQKFIECSYSCGWLDHRQLLVNFLSLIKMPIKYMAIYKFAMFFNMHSLCYLTRSPVLKAKDKI